MTLGSELSKNGRCGTGVICTEIARPHIEAKRPYQKLEVRAYKDHIKIVPTPFFTSEAEGRTSFR